MTDTAPDIEIPEADDLPVKEQDPVTQPQGDQTAAPTSTVIPVEVGDGAVQYLRAEMIANWDTKENVQIRFLRRNPRFVEDTPEAFPHNLTGWLEDTKANREKFSITGVPDSLEVQNLGVVLLGVGMIGGQYIPLNVRYDDHDAFVSTWFDV